MIEEEDPLDNVAGEGAQGGEECPLVCKVGGRGAVEWEVAGRGRWFGAYLAISSATAVVVFAQVLGSRNLAIVTLVSLLVVFHYRYRRIPNRIVVPAPADGPPLVSALMTCASVWPLLGSWPGASPNQAMTRLEPERYPTAVLVARL